MIHTTLPFLISIKYLESHVFGSHEPNVQIFVPRIDWGNPNSYPTTLIVPRGRGVGIGNRGSGGGGGGGGGAGVGPQYLPSLFFLLVL